uniref:C-type lectin domain-containing protein n=1 Tax=Cyprinus carpio TaxID=7962 RepID=A0A8C1S1P0_CYPCA
MIYNCNPTVRICVRSHGRECVCAASAVRLVCSFVIWIYDDVFTYRWLKMLILTGLFWRSSGISRQYYYINTAMSWPEAQSYCRERFTDLATVDSMDDVNRLVNVVDAGYNGSVWIGLKRGAQTRWAWSNGENKTSDCFFRHWAAGQPSASGDCVGMSRTNSGRWAQYSCRQQSPFICHGSEHV